MARANRRKKIIKHLRKIARNEAEYRDGKVEVCLLITDHESESCAQHHNVCCEAHLAMMLIDALRASLTRMGHEDLERKLAEAFDAEDKPSIH